MPDLDPVLEARIREIARDEAEKIGSALLDAMNKRDEAMRQTAEHLMEALRKQSDFNEGTMAQLERLDEQGGTADGDKPD